VEVRLASDEDQRVTEASPRPVRIDGRMTFALVLPPQSERVLRYRVVDQ
jgi:hypothetical protein